jgi:WD40 repeat protein
LALSAFTHGQSATSPVAIESPLLQIELGGHGAAVRRIAVDLTRDLVVTGSDDKTARTWGLADGTPQRVFRPPVAVGEVGRVYGAALHPKQPWVAIGGTLRSASARSSGPAHVIYLYDTQSGELLRRFDARAGDIKRLAWSDGGNVLVAGYAGEHGVRAFDVQGNELFADAFTDGVYALSISAGKVAAAGLDGSVRVYSVIDSDRPGVQLASRFNVPRNATSLAFSPDGSQLAIGYFEPGRSPDVLTIATGSTATIASPQLGRGTLMTVAWSAHDQTLFFGGSFGFESRNVKVVAHDLRTRRNTIHEVGARQTITDLVPLTDGRLAFAVADGSWGVARGGSVLVRPSAQVPDLTGPLNLRVSDDGRQVSWSLDGGENHILFDLARRTITAGSGSHLAQPLIRKGLLNAPTGWQNDNKPEINGKRVPLQTDEISRAVSLFPNGDDAVLGTSRALYRVAPDGRIAWRIQTQTEVRAVNVRRDGKVVLTTMLDGTVRWWRSSDGQQLLSMLVLRDGRWVLWTPDGYFDAGVGADSLVGWVVNRANGDGTDYYPVGRLRERFHQPRYIDLLLESLDPAATLARHQAEIKEEAVQVAQASPPAQAPATQPPATEVTVESFPPALSTTLATKIIRIDKPTGDATIPIPYSVVSRKPSSQLLIEARVDGRPAPTTVKRPPAAADGKAEGEVQVTVHSAAQSIQLLARDASGYSEPLSFLIERPAKPLAAARPSAAATAEMPRLFLLAIGVSDYERAQYRLRLAAKDARDFAAVARGQAGKFYSEVAARTLVDKEASQANVRAQLKWLAESGRSGDVTMLFIAGHGVTSRDGRYHFMPYDGKHENLAGSAVAEEEIRSALRSAPGRVILFVDTCFAGSAIGADRSRDVARFVNDLASPENGVVVFASSAPRQVSLEFDDWQNGAFTWALVRGFAGKADLMGRGVVTYKGLDYYVSEEVKRLTDTKQTPVTLSPWGLPDFALAAI